MPPASASRGALVRRERLLRELPAALEAEERRLFAAAKRAEAAGEKARAAALFQRSRDAYDALGRLRGAASSPVAVDGELERAHRLWVKLRELAA